MKEIENAIEHLKERLKLAVFGGSTAISTEVAHLALKALEKQIKGGWIPVSERLPENNVKCLVTVQYENFAGIYSMVTTGAFNDKKIALHGEQPVISNRKVIAWMPLPEPYKEE